jgi:hypothetical protein
MHMVLLIVLLVFVVLSFLWWLLERLGVPLDFWNKLLENQRLRAEAEAHRREQHLAPLKETILDQIHTEASLYGRGIKEESFEAEGYSSADIRDAVRQLSREKRIRTNEIGRWIVA